MMQQAKQSSKEKDPEKAEERELWVMERKCGRPNQGRPGQGKCKSEKIGPTFSSSQPECQCATDQEYSSAPNNQRPNRELSPCALSNQ